LPHQPSLFLATAAKAETRGPFMLSADDDAHPDLQINNAGAGAQKKMRWKAFVHRHLPIFKWAPTYAKQDWYGDVIAGLTAGMMVLPQGLAYAQVAQLEQHHGLYSAFMGPFAYCLLGTVQEMSIGPTALVSLLVSKTAEGDLTKAVGICLMTGLIQMVLGVLQLGCLVDLISHPVTSGFVSAAAITIACSQFPKVLGIKARRDFIECWEDIFHHIHLTRWQDVLLGLGCIAILVAIPKIARKKAKTSKFWYWLAIGRNAVIVLLASLLSYLLSLASSSSASPFQVVGEVAKGLPPFKAPSLSGDDLGGMVGAGVLCAMVGFLENITLAKAMVKQRGAGTVDASQELIALGAGNVLCSFVSGFVATGSFSRSVVSKQAGARTPAAGVVTGGLVLVALVALTPGFKFIPNAALAAVIITAVLSMVEGHVVMELLRLGKRHPTARLDLLCLLVSFFGCLIFEIMYGMSVAVALSCLILVYKQTRPQTHAHALHQQGCLVFRMDGPVVFSSAAYLQDLVRLSEQRHFGSHQPHRIDSQEDPAHVNTAWDHDVDVDVDVDLETSSSSWPSFSSSSPSSSSLSVPLSPMQSSIQTPLLSSSSPSPSSSSSSSSSASSSSSSSLRVCVLDMSRVCDVDLSGVKAIEELAHVYSARSPPVSLRLVAVLPHIQSLLVEAAHLSEEVFYASVEEAVSVHPTMISHHDHDV